MRTTITLSANLNCSPFVVFDQDVDEVIMLINFYIRLDDGTDHSSQSENISNEKEQRIRVNDKTATGGWW